MAQGNKIIVTAEPHGTYLEGIVVGALQPGVICQIQAAVEPVSDRHSWQPFQGSTGAKAMPLAVLLEDRLRGKLMTDPYTSGDRCRLYVPLPGEDMNLLLKNISGTADAFAIGDLLGIETATGRMLANSSYTNTPAKVMATTAALTADSLVWCMIT